VERGQNLVDCWKIFVSSAYGAGESFPHSILGKPFIGAPGTVCTETYTVIGPFSSEQETRNALSYFSTRLFRFLVLLHKPTQHATQSVYTFVPRMDFTKPWTDADLYSYFGLDSAEVVFIESMVRPMELDND
jgi:site-specific DNA-methyltransferase (adenine-specific)